MKRRHAMAGLLSLGAVLVSGAALAASVEQQVVAQLRAQGYSGIRVTRTLLGRLRFTADRGDHSREIIINPSTGEILRDYVEAGEDVRIIDRSGGGDSGRGGGDDRPGDDDRDEDRSGRGGGGDDDRDDDDRSGRGGGDDDRDDDNSGPGGGDDRDDDNSGPGGGGSGGGDDDDDPDDD